MFDSKTLLKELLRIRQAFLPPTALLIDSRKIILIHHDEQGSRGQGVE
jgi:hypothetical protein